jgi:glycosyl hydrolase family 113
MRLVQRAVRTGRCRLGRPAAGALALWLMCAAGDPADAQRLDGFNIIAAPGHSFGGETTRRALAAARRLGAVAVAVVPFLWQPDPASPDIIRGSDMSDDELRAAIRAARALGFQVVAKPHVWVPAGWAGAVEPGSEAAWRGWFARYRVELVRIAKIAADEGADAVAIGTELAKTTQRSEWRDLIVAVRAAFPRTLLYVAHNVEEAEAVPFWGELDMIGVTLYPPLGRDEDVTGRIAIMRTIAARLDALAARLGKPVVVAEIGLRSAKGATAKPWESAEERVAPPDPLLQAEVLAEWLDVLDRPAIRGVLVWRWFTDPDAGGPLDTDFTVQGKSAEAVLRCVWSRDCGRR